MPIRPWKIIPSMYQRRLLLVAGGAVLMFTLPALQVLNLTVAKGGELRAEAEKRLVNRRWIRTIRGQIVDRKGRVLAVDRASFDIAVDYPVLTGKWAYTQAAARARRFNPHWNELAPSSVRNWSTSTCPSSRSASTACGRRCRWSRACRVRTWS